MSDTKNCPGCSTEKPVSDFHRAARRKDGLARLCRPCTSEWKRQWRQKNPDKAWAHNMWSHYRLRPEDYEALLDSQDRKCLICDKQFDGIMVHIDHDHQCCSGIKTCGQCIRGALCARCNSGIAAFENLDMDRVMAYLGKSRHLA